MERTNAPALTGILDSSSALALTLSLRERASREATGLFSFEGARFVRAAIDTAVPIACAISCPPLLCGFARQCLAELKAKGTPIHEVRVSHFKEISQAPEASGIAALAPLLWTPLPDRVQRNGLWVAIERIRNPGNLGTILRAAEAAGATGLIVLDRELEGTRHTTDPHDPAVVRGSMGAIFGLELVRTPYKLFKRWPVHRNGVTIGAETDSSIDYREVDWSGPTVLMLGSERKGLSEGQRALCTHIARIPMIGRTSSLNVGVATGILLYEAFRQRNPVRAASARSGSALPAARGRTRSARSTARN